MATATQALQNYAESFSGLEKSAASEPSFIHNLRRGGFARFSEKGFPTIRDEDWRFTNLSAIAQTPFRLVRNGHRGPSPSDISAYRLVNAACGLVFVDGRFSPSLSSTRDLPRGVHAGSLAEEMATNPGAIEPLCLDWADPCPQGSARGIAQRARQGSGDKSDRRR